MAVGPAVHAPAAAIHPDTRRHTPTHPDPTAMTDPATASTTVTGRLVELGEEQLVLALPGTEYKLHLKIDQRPADAKVGQKLTGTIHARAKRVDRINAGGRYVEPVFGRPRRIQGRVIGGDASSNTLIVQAGPGLTLHCVLTDPRQKIADFHMHQMVSFDVEPGARFVVA